MVHQLLQPGFAQRQQLGDHADVLLRSVDREPLDGLVQLPVQLARHDLRLADGQLEALAPHQLDEHRELQLTAPLHFPGIRARRRQDAERDVPDQLLRKSLFHHARSQAVTVLTGERRGVDADRHGEARLVDADHRERTWIVRISQGLPDRHLRNACNCHQLAGPRLIRINSIERLGDIELGDLCPFDPAV